MRGVCPALCSAALLIDRGCLVRGFALSPASTYARNGAELSWSESKLRVMTALPSDRHPDQRRARRARALPRRATSSTDESTDRLNTAGAESSAEVGNLDDALHPSLSSRNKVLSARDDTSSLASGLVMDTAAAAAAAAAATTTTVAAAEATPYPQTDPLMGEGQGEVHEREEFDAAEMMNRGAERVLSGMNSAVEGVGAAPLKRGADGRLDIDGQGLLNLCILLSAGLWAVHSIVTVDATMWRGWTVQETLMRLPWDNWDSYETGLQEHPILTKTAINIGIYLIGDWLSQVNWGREEDIALWEFDLQRTLRNGLIGAIFGPLVHYYYDFSDWILPPNVGTNRPLKIMLDQSIYFVSKCAMYISLVSLLRGDSLEETKETVQGRLKGVVTTGWRFWPFVHVFTYFLIPPRHRVLWVNCVDLLWSSILAGMTSGTPADDTGDGDQQQPEEHA